MSVQSGKLRTILPGNEPPKSSSFFAKSSTDLRQGCGPQAALAPVTTQELTREVQCVVLQFPTAEIVEGTQASLRAVENIRNGESGMSLKTFVNLCRANPAVREMVKPLLGYGDENNPDVVRAISVLMNTLVREKSRGGDETSGMGGSGGGGGEEACAASPDLFDSRIEPDDKGGEP